MRWCAVAWILAGCYQPTPPEGAPCSASTECPTPLTCEMGHCMRGPVADARRGDGSLADATDALADAAVCSALPAQMFSAPVIESVLSAAALDGTPTLTADQLEIFFKSGRLGGSGGGDLWTSRRTSLAAAWAPPTAVTEVNTGAFEGSPEISGDGLRLWFASSRPGGLGQGDLWVTTRPSRAMPWAAPTLIPELASASDEEGIMVLPSELVVYFHSSRGGTPIQIYRAERASVVQPWSTPVLVAGLATGGDDQNPWVSADECHIFFDSNVAGGVGGADLYVASRAVPGSALGPRVRLTELSSANDDSDPWLSPDFRTIEMASDRPNGANLYDLFHASR